MITILKKYIKPVLDKTIGIEIFLKSFNTIGVINKTRIAFKDII